MLYRLHDQTVEITIEETDAPDHPRPDIELRTGVFTAGGNVIQHVGPEHDAVKSIHVSPEITPLGDGAFQARVVLPTEFGIKINANIR